jgi:hypothetical protein
MTTAADKDFTSIGQLAAHTQRPVRALEQAATSLRIQPALRLNGVSYFSAPQVQKITAVVSEPRNSKGR